MTTFKELFSNAEAVDEEVDKAVANLAKNARQLRKARRDGHTIGIKKAHDQFGSLSDTLQQTVSAASSAYSFTDEKISRYMEDEEYTDELCQKAKELGCDIVKHDGVLISYPPKTIRPLIIRWSPTQRVLWIDRKEESNPEPLGIAKILAADKKKATSKPTAFLEALYKAYSLIAKPQNVRDMFEGHGPDPVVELTKIHKGVPASHSGNKRGDSKVYFAREIYLLDSGEIRKTRSGATVSFPSSTGLKSGKGIFSFPDRHKNIINYYGIQFSGGK